MTDVGPLPESQPTRHRPTVAAANLEPSDEVEKWVIVAGTVLGLATLTVLHFNGGRAQFTRKRTSFLFEVGRERSSTVDASTFPLLPQE